MTQSVAYPTHLAPVPAKGRLKTAPETFGLIPNPQTQTAIESGRLGRVCLAVADSVGPLTMIISTWPLLLSSVLLAGNAVAQTPSWPITSGRHLQPTQQQIDSRENNPARQRDRDARSQVDRLFDELTRDPAPRKR
jgi:hypothetical protein